MSTVRARLVDELLQNEQVILLTFLLALTPVMGHGVDKVARTTKPGGGENSGVNARGHAEVKP